jgi:Fe-S-cluster containining protein
VRIPIPTTCAGCGVCCDGQEALPVGYWLSILGADDPRELPADIRAELENKRDLFDVIGWPANGQACVWFDHTTKGCRNYKWRPQTCIDFKLGGRDCRRVRAAALGGR